MLDKYWELRDAIPLTVNNLSGLCLVPLQSVRDLLAERDQRVEDLDAEKAKLCVLSAKLDETQAELDRLEKCLTQVDDVLMVDWLTVKDDDYRQALHDLISFWTIWRKAR